MTKPADGSATVSLSTSDIATLQSHLKSILESVPDGMIVIDETGQILAFSKAAETLFGYAASDIIGRNVSELMAGRDEANHDQYINNYLNTGDRQISRSARPKLAITGSSPRSFGT